MGFLPDIERLAESGPTNGGYVGIPCAIDIGMSNNTTMRDERCMIECMIDYSPSDFPGSKRWKATQAARATLAAWDAAHPEIVAEIEAEKAAKLAARNAAINPWTL